MCGRSSIRPGQSSGAPGERRLQEQRLASVLNIPAVELLDALDLCNLTLDKDKHNVVIDHMDLIVWVQHKGTAT